jgi:hypothetical protein
MPRGHHRMGSDFVTGAAYPIHEHEQELRLLSAPNGTHEARRCERCRCVLRRGNPKKRCAPCESRFLKTASVAEIRQSYARKET